MLTAVIWGVSFVSQRVGMEFIKPNTFNGIRTMIGVLILIPFIFVRDKAGKSRPSDRKKLIIGSIVCGALLCAAGTLQTWGMVYTTSGKSGFITAMYMIFVPIIGLFAGKKIRAVTVLGVALAVAGMYMLSIGGTDFVINKGDIITLACAFIFAFHIMAIDRFSSEVDCVKLACLQFFVCGTINIILMFLFEHPDWELVRSCAVPILWPCYFGTDIPSRENLVACKYDMEGIRKLIGADSLGFLSVESLGKIIPNARCGYCDGCFSGKYPVDIK